MAEICKNCEYEIALNFCANCGQKKTKRIDRDYLKDELQYTVLHMNKGFLYSLKRLIKNPGKTAKEFVEGNRVNHYKPIVMVFLLSGIVAFLTNTLIHPEIVYAKYVENQTHKPPFDIAGFSAFLMKYYSFITLIVVVPTLSLFTWLTFRKWGYNYYENIVTNSYFYSLLMVFTIVVTIPIQYLLKDNPALYMTLPSFIVMMVSMVIFFWFFVGLYPQKSPGDVIVRCLVLFGVTVGASIVLSVLIGIIYGMFFLGK